MNMRNSFLGKYFEKDPAEKENMSKSSTIFHNLIVNESQYYGRDSFTKTRGTK